MIIFALQGLSSAALTFLLVKNGYGISAYFYGTLSSAAFFFPLFALHAWQHASICLRSFKEQLVYSAPLAVTALLYNSFFIVDRLIIKASGGYDILGQYAILWRFGTLFQFFAVALCEVAPLMFFHADHEEERQELSRKILLFLIITLSASCAMAAAGSYYLLLYTFPAHYHHLGSYLPFFFFSCYLIEIARLLQVYAAAANKTKYLAYFACTTLGMQTALLISIKKAQLWSVIIANSCAFSFYLIGLIMLLWLPKKAFQRSVNTSIPQK